MLRHITGVFAQITHEFVENRVTVRNINNSKKLVSYTINKKAGLLSWAHRHPTTAKSDCPHAP
jgi:hypothetical protein